MACNNPMIGFMFRYPDGSKQLRFHPDGRKASIMFDDRGFSSGEKLEIPCGKCIGCRLEYSRQWSIRCLLELKQHNPEECWFLTLTFSDEAIYNEKNGLLDMVRNRPVVDELTGEVTDETVLSLDKSVLQKFMKRLRTNAKRQFDVDCIRFYACGEYGDKNHRPHFHLIVFGLPLNDLTVYSKNHRGEIYYQSKFLSDTWGFGLAIVGRVTFDSCAYVARYVMKKRKGATRVYYEENNIEPEFCTMSRKPGLAKSYFDEHTGEIYQYDQVIVCRSDGTPVRSKPPSYFDRLFDIEHHEELESIKLHRAEVAKARTKETMKRTDVDRGTYLKIRENNKQFCAQKLLRSL